VVGGADSVLSQTSNLGSVSSLHGLATRRSSPGSKRVVDPVPAPWGRHHRHTLDRRGISPALWQVLALERHYGRTIGDGREAHLRRRLLALPRHDDPSGGTPTPLRSQGWHRFHGVDSAEETLRAVRSEPPRRPESTVRSRSPRTPGRCSRPAGAGHGLRPGAA